MTANLTTTQLNERVRAAISAYKTGKLPLEQLKRVLTEEAQPASPKKPLSEGQKGIWALQQAFPTMSAYNVPLCFRAAELDLEVLRRTCETIVKHFSILRSVIIETPRGPLRELRPLDCLTEVKLAPELAADAVIDQIRETAKLPFSLEAGPLFRVHAFTGLPQQTFLLVTIHHIILDGTSLVLLLDTFFQTYLALKRGEPPKLHVAGDDYDLFVAHELQMLQSQDGAARMKYWQKRLEGIQSPVGFSADHPPRPIPEFTGATLRQELTPSTARRLLAVSRRSRVYPSTLFLALLKVLLHRHTDATDIIIGMPVSARVDPRFRETMGPVMNMIPVRSHCAASDTFESLLTQLQRHLIDDNARQYPFAALVRSVLQTGYDSPSPLFRVAFMYQDFMARMPSRWDGFEPVDDIRQEGEYELVLEVLLQPQPSEAFSLCWKFDPQRFEQETVDRLGRHYQCLLDQVLEDLQRPLADYRLSSEVELHRLVVEFNATEREFEAAAPVHELFQLQARRTPDAIAVSSSQASLTYAQLDRASDALAVVLRESGVGPESLVGIALNRDPLIVCAMLGTTKAGAAYVPLDPSYPQRRLQAIVSDSGIRALLTVAELADDAAQVLNQAGSDARLIVLDAAELQAEPNPQRSQPPKRRKSPEDLAYVMYTSGSTGAPKGVMIPHRALTNFLLSMAERPGLSPSDRLLAVTTCSFDIAGLELLLPLIVGAQCHIVDAAADPERLLAAMHSFRPTVMQGTPSMWRMLFLSGWENTEGVRILCGGEALPDALRDEFLRTGSEAWNMYGPTETTIWSTLDRVVADSATTIGRPIANTQIYILDHNDQPAPLGVAGELCIAGRGVARGYLNNDALTRERFIDNPFSSRGRDARVLYRTGDLARWRDDGRIDYLGRRDQQVKIRGHRLELGAVETALQSHPAVKQAVVVARPHEGTHQLVAFVVAHSDQTASELPARLQDHVAQELPDYMVPSLVTCVDTVPLTLNGKLDRAALVRRPLAVVPSTLRAPSTEGPAPALSQLEASVLEIWREVLQIDAIAPELGFFEGGGTSLSAVSVARRISERFDIPFKAAQLFKHSTPRSVALYLRGQIGPAPTVAGPGNLHIQPVRVETPSPTSFDGPSYYADALAIVGISCQFPGARDHREFWTNLRAGRASARFFSKEELRRLGTSESALADPSFVPMQLTIDGKYDFDPDFFNITPKDAALMDPQFRLLLMHSWSAIEDAGYVPDAVPETGVFMATSNSYYQALLRSQNGVADDDEYQAWLFAQGGTVPTRISYELGLSGPSIAIHSNCSSGLVGLSAAHQSILSGDSKCALVGAATLFPSSEIGYRHRPGLNFSSDGRCKAFDANADGLITGEGVCVLMVKSARQAVADGDHVYAIVRGVSVNNDGRDKAGFYAPSASAQSDVVARALTRTGVAPETVGYVEAHGTGTRLGDPIEINALTEAYRRFTPARHFCGLGSVKPNVGHLDTVAALSGCVKVALSLYHRELPPSINYQSPNPQIDFEDSPFFVVERLTPWAQPDNEIPRRAGLSAMGIGGTNGHAILEEARRSSAFEADTTPRQDFVFPLSARTEAVLRTYAQGLRVHLSASDALVDIADIAFTLQTGRTPMSVRVAFVAHDIDTLCQGIDDFLNGSRSSRSYVFDDRGESRDLTDLLDDEEERDALCERWLALGNLHKLARAWVKGLNINWRKQHTTEPRQRLSLPTYPFAKQAFKLPKRESPATSTTASLHPMILERQHEGPPASYMSRFTGQEFFLFDHVVRGRRMLPGVAYLEMARFAATHWTQRPTVGLHDVVWMQPIIVDEGAVEVRVQLDLVPNQADRVAFTVSRDSGENQTVYCQGTVTLGHSSESRPTRQLDVSSLRAEGARDIAASDFYRYLDAGGGNYGPSFRTVTQLHKGEETALARLTLPSNADTRLPLHPSMMDAAFQIADSLILQPEASGGVLPFFVRRVDVFGATPTTGYVHVRRKQNSSSGDAVARYDIDILDDSGAVRVAFHDFTARTEAHGRTEFHPLYRSWRWQEAASSDERNASPTLRKRLLALVAGSDEATLESLQRVADADVHSLVTADSATPPTSAARRMFAELGDVLSSARSERQAVSPGVVVVLPESAKMQAAALAELLSEDPRDLRVAIVVKHGLSVASAKQLSNLLALEARELAAAPHIRQVTYQADGRRLEHTQLPRNVERWLLQTSSLKVGGVYWVCGANSIAGRTIASHLSALGNVTLILTDRRASEASEVVGGHFIQADPHSRSALEHALRQIREQWGRPSGVLFCACSNAPLEELEAASSLDEVVGDLDLDFFAWVSSAEEACHQGLGRLMSTWVTNRDACRQALSRRGTSLAVVGPTELQAPTGAFLLPEVGVHSRPALAVLQAFYHLLESAESGLLSITRHVHAADESHIEETASIAADSPTPASASELQQRVVDELKRLVSELIHVPVLELDQDREFGDYGLDSLSLTTLTTKVNQYFELGGDGPSLDPTIFFEHPNLRALSAHLYAAHGSRIQAKLSPHPQRHADARAATAVPSCSVQGEHAIRQHAPQPLAPAGSPREWISDDIAIVGVSAQFPKARNIAEYWENLRRGNLCISEVPQDRWDWREYFGDPSTEVNKTDVKWGGFIDGLADFDPLFFNISPREAYQLDPTHRLLLMHVWAAIEDAGYNPRSLAGTNTGLFVGVANSGYADLRQVIAAGVEANSFLGVVPSIGVNRVSHFLDFHGPSEPIETACSSSLVAIHRAVTSIRCGDCDMALVGGIQTILTPHAHIGFSKAGMLARDGRCKTFAAEADGFVRGEGAGLLFLKRLRDAQTAGDPIYGVVKGSAVNHDGRSNTLTAPNPRAQASVIVEAIRRARVDPRTISYVEAHGTGTELGDPIEINALKAAFDELERDGVLEGDVGPVEPECHIGAVKTGIGHLELAAGVAGVVKVLLQMRHATLAKSFFDSQVNPYIDLSNTRFKLLPETQDWARLRDLRGNELPRRAGVSSFGIGGVNAHVVLQEPPSSRPTRLVSDAAGIMPALFVLSAKDEQRLHDYAEAMLRFVENEAYADDNGWLHRLAFTLQVGREAMAERLGLVVESRAELVEKLRSFLSGSKQVAGLVRGRVPRQERGRGSPTPGSDLAQLVTVWLEKGLYQRVLELWVQGTDVDWSRVTPAFDGYEQPPRLHVPSYPFARERYWIDQARSAASDDAPRWQGPFSEQVELRGDEFYVRDHRIHGSAVLPGVAYLALLRRCAQKAIGRQANVELENLAWIRPLALDQPRQLTIELAPKSDEVAVVAVYSHADGQPILLCEGTIRIVSNSVGETIELAAIRRDLENGKALRLASAEAYRAFAAAGIDYGPSMQSLLSLEARADAVLARIELPDVTPPAPEFDLHPGVLDACLQACVGLDLAAQMRHGRPILPFSLERLEVLSECPRAVWAWIRFASSTNAGPFRKLDVHVCDDAGRVCVRLRGLASRPLTTKLRSRRPDDAEGSSELFSDGTVGLLARTPVWSVWEKPQTAPAARGRLLVVGGSDEQRAAIASSEAAVVSVASPSDAVRHAVDAFDHVVWLNPSPAPITSLDDVDNVLTSLEHGLYALFRFVKALLSQGAAQRPLQWTVVTTRGQATTNSENVDAAQAAVHGFIGSMAKEFVRWKARLVDVDEESPWTLDSLLELPSDAEGNAVAYRQGRWYRQTLLPVRPLPPAETSFRSRALYVIVGGAGGIGVALTEWLIVNFDARVVWIGRRPIDESIQSQLTRLESLGQRPVYVQADATRADELRRARERIVELQWDGEKLPIRGVVHCAIVLADASLMRMDETRFRNVVASKLDVAVRLAQAFGSNALDFALFCSSITSFGKAPGQSNYASGCMAKDAFAQLWRQLSPYPVKVINWGYWGSVGVVRDERYRQQVQRAGFASIEPGEGMPALNRFLSSGFDQLAIVKMTRPSVSEPSSANEWMQSLSCSAIARPDPKRLHALAGRLNAELPGWKAIAPEASASNVQDETLIAQLLLCAVSPFIDRARPAPTRFERWFTESFSWLESNGYLVRDEGGHLTAGHCPDREALWAQWQERKPTWDADPRLRAAMQLAEACLRALPEVLSEQRRATDVMFPNGSLALVAGLYQQNPIVDLFNDVVHKAVLAALPDAPTHGVRLLEIGAGTGGTTAGLLPHLDRAAAHITEYAYTDLSQSFLNYARQNYAPGRPYLVPRIFNVENAPTAQDLPTCNYDIVLATNVLHATRDIRRTLRNAKAVMNPGGTLVLNELSCKTLFAHVTFGLLDGWWLYDDSELRLPGSPALSPETWARVLKEEGFQGAFFPARPFHHLGQQVIVAQSDGVIRQQGSRPPLVPVEELLDNHVDAVQRRFSGQAPPTGNAPASDAPASDAPTAVPTGPALDCDRAAAKQRLQQYLRRTLSAVLQVPETKLAEDEPFSSYGVDSILALSLLRELENAFGSLSKTLFFEFETLTELLDYFLDNHPSEVQALVDKSANESSPTRPSADVHTPSSPPPRATDPICERKGSAPQAASADDHPDEAHELQSKVREYLRGMLARVLQIPQERIDDESSFSGYGTDSILALSLIRELEADFGSLSKTLFFEYESIAELADYLIDNHVKEAHGLQHRDGERTDSDSAPSGVASQEPAETSDGVEGCEPQAEFVVVDKNRPPEEGEILQRLNRVRNSSSPDGVLLDLWHHLYVGPEGEHIHFLTDTKLLFATRYVGNPDHEPRLVSALMQHAKREGLDFCYLDMSNRRKGALETACGLLSLPIGVVQTLENIAEFSLAGSKMRRLRYLVEKFKKSGDCRLIEYTTQDPKLDREIETVILAWSREKKVVNKVDAIVRAMRDRTLLHRYRVYLTYVDDALQNVIILGSYGNGYLTDQEYYLPSMPAGGTEYAYTEIITRLANEGRELFSLGLTWGRFEPKEGFSDESGWALLRDTKGQLSQILLRGTQNYQYKNKFRPREYPVYIYRAEGTRREIIKQCLGQFFRHGVPFEEIRQLIESGDGDDDGGGGGSGGGPPASDSSTKPSPPPVAGSSATEPRLDVTRIDPKSVTLDMMTDSWAHLNYAFIQERYRALVEGIAQYEPSHDPVEGVFGKRHYVLTTSGRQAERLFFQTLRSKAKTIVQNVAFFSTLNNIVKAGLRPLELPNPAILDSSSDLRFRGGVDLDRVRSLLNDRAGDVALVFVELCNNASGGYPVAYREVEKLSGWCRELGIPLVLDVTRIAANAELVRRYEPGHGDVELWTLVRRLAELADVVIGSLCKSFGVTSGGIIAANDGATIARLQRYGEIEGGVLSDFDADVVRLALQTRHELDGALTWQLDTVAALHRELLAAGVPLMGPGGAHCLLLLADEYREWIHDAGHNDALRVLFETHGIRAGVHSAGGLRDTPLNRCLRLALPLGLTDERLPRYLAEVLKAPTKAREKLDFTRQSIPHEDARVAPQPPTAHAVSQDRAETAVAVIGIAGRYPDAVNCEQFWNNLESGRCSIREIPPERWAWADHYHPDPDTAARQRKSYGKWGAFLEQAHSFDPMFFEIAPRRAALLDPQERLFLQECWNAFEDAGYPPARLSPALRERTGVFAAVVERGYGRNGPSDTWVQTSAASMVGRVSHFFDFKGPSLAVQAHCASSLVAVHEACEYIRRGTGRLALAGGVSLTLHPSNFVDLSLVRMLSADHLSAAFQAGGIGFVPGEAVGAVVLKSLVEARRDGDPVYAVIRGSAINHSGRTRYFGKPSQAAQAQVLRSALENARVDPRTIGYIEAAASGVEESDAVELAAIAEVYGGSEGCVGTRAIGSVKPNIGHCEIASGMSQLTKLVLALKHRTRPPTLFGQQLNPRFDFSTLPFSLESVATRWEPIRVDGKEVPRRAGLTALGSGTNVHIILEEAPNENVSARSPSESARPSSDPILFLLSARDRHQLQEYARSWIAYLETHPELDLVAAAHTLRCGREPMAARLAIVTRDHETLMKSLMRWTRGETPDNIAFGQARSTSPMTQDAVEEAIHHEQWSDIAQAWATGSSVLWPQRGSPPPQRLHGLPSYPFATDRYSIADLQHTGEVHLVAATH